MFLCALICSCVRSISARAVAQLAQVVPSGSIREDVSRVPRVLFSGGKVYRNQIMRLHAFIWFAAITTAKAYSLLEEECINYNIYPVEYELTLMPNVYEENMLYYDGKVTITVIANAPGIRVIKLDAMDMEIISDSIEVWYDNRNIIDTKTPDFDKKGGKLYLFLKEDLNTYGGLQEHRYRIKISFTKKLNFKEDVHEEGIFFSRYDENHIDRYMISTRLHPDRAKRMFPCFDNPLFESVYRIKVYQRTVKQEPNMILGPTCLTISTESRRYTPPYNYTIIEYLPSNQIAPHQMGFHLSHYIQRRKIVDKSNDTIIVWASNPEIDNYDYILNLGGNLTEILNTYSVNKRPITNGPINLVPIPVFMDNYEIDSWNLLTNGDHRMMVIEQYTSVQQKEEMSFQLAQQLSRVWLGNPGEVAHTRWREHWFKEGMATYLAYFLMSKLQATYSNMRTYGFQTRIKAMDMDWREAVPSLGYYNKTLGVHLTFRDRQLVSAKTAALLWMVENWLRSEVFHSALQHYIESRRGKFISIEDFANFLQSKTIKCEFFEGYTVSDVLNSWINQPGYPLIDVHVYRYNDTDDIIELKQKHFTFKNNLRKDYKYKVPISYTTLHEENCFSCNQPKFIIGDAPYHFKENINDGWIVLNKNASGYYRVNYDKETWQRIIQTLNSPERTKIDRYNRAQIMNDAFALYVAGEIDFNLARDILKCLDNEDSFVVWDSAFAGFELLKIESAAVDMSKQLYYMWEQFMRDRVSSIYKRMANEFERDHQTRMFRSKVITFACQIGHELCIQDLKSEINRIRRRETYDPDLREICYYELQKSWQGMHASFKELNRFEKDDMVAAKNKFLRESEFRTNLPEILLPPERIVSPPNNIYTTQSTPTEKNPATLKPSSAIAIKLSVVTCVMSAFCVNILR